MVPAIKEDTKVPETWFEEHPNGFPPIVINITDGEATDGDLVAEAGDLASVFFSSRRRHTRCSRDWSSDVCSSDLHHGDPQGPTSVVAVGLSEEFCRVAQNENLDDYLVSLVARLGGLLGFRDLRDDSLSALEKEQSIRRFRQLALAHGLRSVVAISLQAKEQAFGDRKSTRLNSSHGYISYAVFCLKKKKDDLRSIF